MARASNQQFHGAYSGQAAKTACLSTLPPGVGGIPSAEPPPAGQPPTAPAPLPISTLVSPHKVYLNKKREKHICCL